MLLELISLALSVVALACSIYVDALSRRMERDSRARFSERQPDHPAPNFLFSHGGPKYSPEPQISSENREDPAR